MFDFHRKPEFVIPLGEGDGIMLFCPVGMSCIAFKNALMKLDDFVHIGGTADLLKVHGCADGSGEWNESGIDKNNKNGSSYGNEVILKAVRRGPSGELYVRGSSSSSSSGNSGELTVYPGCNPFDLYKEYSSLNQGQKNAVKKVLFAQDYTLLLGLPGTGKTSTLSLIIRIIIARGERVMICSYTHSAVDNLMIKIAESGLTSSFALRIGYENSVNPATRR